MALTIPEIPHTVNFLALLFIAALQLAPYLFTGPSMRLLQVNLSRYSV